MAEPFRSVDDYLASVPLESRQVLQALRQTVLAALPGATEVISYQIVGVRFAGKPLVHYAGYAGHVAIYPVPTGDAAFAEAIAPYRSGKSTVRFRLDEPLPTDLITQLVQLRAAE